MTLSLGPHTDSPLHPSQCTIPIQSSVSCQGSRCCRVLLVFEAGKPLDSTAIELHPPQTSGKRGKVRDRLGFWSGVVSLCKTICWDVKTIDG